MSNFAEIFKSYMDEKGTNYEVINDLTFTITYTGKNMNRVTICIIFREDTDFVSVQCFKIFNMKGKEQEAYQICNKINAGRRWAKFSCDEEGNIRCCADAFISEETVGPITFDIISTIANIADSTYPEFARAHWA